MRFVGEGAVDQGGPRREFFRLLATKANQVYLKGRPEWKFFDTNVSGVQVGVHLASLEMCFPSSCL